MSMFENTLVIDFEIETDKDLLLEFIADSCTQQDMHGKVVVTEGTLRTVYQYEHDGT